MSDPLQNCFICNNRRELDLGPCICTYKSNIRPKDRILLIDVDSTIPNIALMKLSTFYKSIGSEVDLVSLNVSYYPPKRKLKEVDALGYVRVFVSAIFPGSKNFVRVLNNKNVEYGGTGYSLTKNLPDEIEAAECDYSIYPDNDTSYGFITRGCIRNCEFCFVPKKEGLIHQVNTIDEIVRHNKVKFLDNNILAWGNHKDILRDLANRKLRCQFNQGLDARLVDDESAKLLSQLNYIGEYFFAFDKISQKDLLTKKVKLLKKHIISKTWKLKFFLYCNPDMDIVDDVYYRILWCKRHRVLPYFMRDVSCWDSENGQLYIDLAAWCNQPNIFKSMTFSEFVTRRHPNDPERVRKGNVLVERLCIARMVFDGVL